MKLTAKQATVLNVLKRRKRNEDINGPLTAAEIGEIVFHHQPVRHGAREWANPLLRSLEKKGLVEKLRSVESGARCWTISSAGLPVLQQEHFE